MVSVFLPTFTSRLHEQRCGVQEEKPQNPWAQLGYLISNGCFELEHGSCFSLPIQRHSHTKHSFFWPRGDRCRFGDVFAQRTVWLGVTAKVPTEQVQDDFSPVKIEVTEYTADLTTWP